MPNTFETCAPPAMAFWLKEPSQGARRAIRDSVDEIARRSRGAAKAPGRGPGRRLRKIRQFLAKPAGIPYRFSESLIDPARTSHGRCASRTSALRTGTDSGMAPRAIEIAQNGLGDPPPRGWEGESIRRIPYDSQGGLRNGGAHGPHGSRSRVAAWRLRTGGWSYCAK
jgi:hypothetical protein